MSQMNILLLVVKLIAGGIASFFAILLLSKTRETAWMCFASGVIISYGGIVYEFLSMIGIASSASLVIAGVPVLALLFAILPSAFFVASAIIFILKN